MLECDKSLIIPRSFRCAAARCSSPYRTFWPRSIRSILAASIVLLPVSSLAHLSLVSLTRLLLAFSPTDSSPGPGPAPPMAMNGCTPCSSLGSSPSGRHLDSSARRSPYSTRRPPLCCLSPACSASLAIVRVALCVQPPLPAAASRLGRLNALAKPCRPSSFLLPPLPHGRPSSMALSPSIHRRWRNPLLQHTGS
jgi:hypothetical protein